MHGYFLDFLRQIVNPVLSKYYWLLFPNFQKFVDELKQLIFYDEKKYEYFKDYEVLEEYLNSEFRYYWRYFREKYKNNIEVINQVFIEILREVAHYIKPLTELIEIIVRDELEGVEYLVTVVEKSEEFYPLPNAKIELWLQDKLLSEFITNEEGMAHVKLKPEWREYVSTIKMVVSKDGYEDITVPLMLLDGCIKLKRRNGVVKMKVIGDELKPNGIIEKNPIVDCSVSIFKYYHIITKKGVEITKEILESYGITNKDGIIDFRLPFGEYKVQVEAKDFESKLLSLNLDRELIEQEIELKRERFDHLYIIINKIGDTFFYEPIKGCRVLQVKKILDYKNDDNKNIEEVGVKELDVPFIQLNEESDDKGQIVIESKSDFDFSTHRRYKIRITVPVDGRHIEVDREVQPPITEILLLVKPNASEKVLSKLVNFNIRHLSEIDPHKFVEIVKGLLTILGYKNIRITDGPHDKGIDLICTKGGRRTIVQCKKWKEPVGSKEIREFIGAIASEKADEGIFITTSFLTRDAKETVNKVRYEGFKIEIIDKFKLEQLFKNLKE